MLVLAKPLEMFSFFYKRPRKLMVGDAVSFVPQAAWCAHLQCNGAEGSQPATKQR